MEAEAAPRPSTPAELFLNRELSQLEFNRRVLAQASDPDVPLLERLRFLTIFSSNLDEFFEIRVAGLKQQILLELPTPGPDGLPAPEVLTRIAEATHRMVKEQYRLLNAVLLPALEEEGIRLLKRSHWTSRQRAWIRNYFMEQALPVLTPVGLDPAHPFPNVQNKSLNFIVTLAGEDAFGRPVSTAIVQVSRSLPRLIRLPQGVATGPHDFVMISSVLHDNMEALFPGMNVLGCHQFRVTRNSDMFVDEEEVTDLLSALKGELPRRNYGAGVRLEVANNCSPRSTRLLLDRFQLRTNDLYRVNGPVNLHRLGELYSLVDRPDLKYPRFIPGLPERVEPKGDLFETIREGDVLLHHPYQAFTPVVDLVRQAARDRDVLALKQTLYRTGADSPIVDALLEAARAGKDVTAVVELRARFDEAANIRMATRLQEAGVNVVYGVVGYKCHAKMLLIVRREGDRLRRYCHLGTGNYHAGTARAYTDLSLLSADPDLTEDVHHMFMGLTGPGKNPPLNRMLQSPFTLMRGLLTRIEHEANEARAGRPARIYAKMNAVNEPDVILALYRASQAGVPIDLVVRGSCRLRPGVPGLSENIRVRSIVGRFLEHSRVYSFHAGGRDEIWLSSADWMSRNLVRRIEACFPVLDPALKRRIKEEVIEPSLSDNTQAWVLEPDGGYTRLQDDSRPRFSQQPALVDLLAE